VLDLFICEERFGCGASTISGPKRRTPAVNERAVGKGHRRGKRGKRVRVIATIERVEIRFRKADSFT